jgi:hypothetical protein
VPHGGQHQVRLLPVEPAPGQHPGGLDQQDVLVLAVEEVGPELITEDPPGPVHDRPLIRWISD